VYVRDGLQPPTALCNQVLRQCATAYVPWLALSLYEQMQNWGVEPDANSMHYAVQVLYSHHVRSTAAY
jgi:pentatricopeptide repeat protein